METTTEHPNATLIRRGLEAFNRGEIDAFANLVADDVVWHQIGAETIRGKQAMAESMPGAGEVDWQITADVHDVVANDEHAVALVNATGTRNGKTLKYRTAEILHMRDGKITERWAFSDDPEAIKRFFG
jgi:ketosteroid isomerase-like protein